MQHKLCKNCLPLSFQISLRGDSDVGDSDVGDSDVGDIVMLVTLWWWLIWDIDDRTIRLVTFFVMLVIFAMY